MFKKLSVALLLCAFSLNLIAQTPLTKEQILSMSIEELSDLPLEDLMAAVETLGVSSVDELFAMIMNKNVSAASKAEESSFTSPLSTTVITKAEMRSYGISTIEEALRLVPGMIVTEKTNGVYDVQIRGLNNIPDNNMLLYTENMNMLILVDGHPTQFNALNVALFDQLQVTIEDIDRIEVVRGASSALYGVNAVQGVINIVTEHPTQNSTHAQGSFQVGSEDTYVGDAALRWGIGDKWAVGVTIGIQHRGRPTNQIYVIPNSSLYYANTTETQQSTSQEYSYLDFANYLATENGYKSMANGGWLDVSDLDNLRSVYTTDYEQNGLYRVHLTSAMEPESNPSEMFDEPELARRSYVMNGYVNYTPTPDISVYLSGGYVNSKLMSTPISDDPVSLNARTVKQGYVSANAQIKGLSAAVRYNFGPLDAAYMTPGLKFHSDYINADVDYTFTFGDLSLRPAVNFQYNKLADYTPVYDDPNRAVSGDYSWHYVDEAITVNNTDSLSGYLNGEADMWSVAPSLRLDYKLGDFRFIAAVRADKTKAPDKWNPSWQFSASYSINDNNFVRLGYGRAMRGASIGNAYGGYHWNRTGMMPQSMYFEGNEEADLVKIDNIELGYRWQPTPKLLVDAEAYYSYSTDYGALFSVGTQAYVTADNLTSIATSFVGGAAYVGALTQSGLDLSTSTGLEQAKEIMRAQMQQQVASISPNLVSNMQYRNLPFEVNQFGVGLNLDWIITSKLIAKVNANFQQTYINNYGEYSNLAQIQAQVTSAGMSFYDMVDVYSEDGCIHNAISDVMDIAIPQLNAALEANPSLDVTATLMGLTGSALQRIFGTEQSVSFRRAVGYDDMTAEQQNEVLEALHNAGLQGADAEYTGPGAAEGAQYITDPICMYYAVKYSMYRDGSSYYLVTSDVVEPELRDNHKHKATPDFYGALALIYKPTEALSISAFANYVGKQEYQLQYGNVEVDDKFTVNLKVGYKPMSNVEIFFNAHNLFNSDSPEFAYTDPVKGVYTIGVNFGM